MSDAVDRRAMGTFVIVWLGQMVSLIGSGLTAFALGLWVVERSQAATPFALVAMFTVLPVIVLAPAAGITADLHDRRRIMLLADATASVVTLTVASLLIAGNLEIWHVYLAATAYGACAAFQQPAYLAATSQLVPASQLGRAAGMVQMAQAASDVVAPVLAGTLVLLIRVQGVVLIDLATFLLAALALLLVRFPATPRSPATEGSPSDPWEARRRGATAGWSTMREDPGLMALLAFLAVASFASGIIGALLVPLLLTMGSATVTGGAISLAGAGMLAGSLAMSAWGGPRRRILGVLAFSLMEGLGIIAMGLRPSVWLVAAGAAWAHFAIPFVNASNQAIWQERVPAHVQGRVFAIRQMIARAAMPLAFLIAGPLADSWLEPLMMGDSPLALGIGGLIGSGPGRGIGLLFMLMGMVISLAAVIGWLTPSIRQIGESRRCRPGAPPPGPVGALRHSR